MERILENRWFGPVLRRPTAVVRKILYKVSGRQALAEDLCTNCGLCCNGTVFKCAMIEQDEDTGALKAMGARFTVENQQIELVLPCVAHIDGRCSVYPHRFKICESFRCKLLQDYLRGKVSRDRALEVVGETSLHTNRVEELIRKTYDEGESETLLELYRNFRKAYEEKNEAASFEERYKHIVLEYVALDYRLDKYFRGRVKKKV